MQDFQDGQTQTVGGVTYVRQGGQWRAQTAPPAAPGGRPVFQEGPPQPAPVRPVVEQRDRVALQKDIRDLNKPEPIPGYPGWFMGTDGKPFRPEGLPERPGGGNSMPVAAANDFKAKVSAFGALQRAVGNFNPEYSGPGSGLENMAQGVLPVGTEGQRDWWADFKQTDNITRNALFGASLSEGERKAYAETTITPNMRPEEVRRNLTRRLEIARDVLAREKEFLLANGYKEEAVSALLGGAQLDPVASGAQPNPDPGEVKGIRLTPEQEQQYYQLIGRNPPPSPQEINDLLARFGVRAANADDIALAREQGAAPGEGIDYSQVDAEARAAAQQRLEQMPGESPAETALFSGAMLGLKDETAGVGSAIGQMFTGDMDVAGNYIAARDAERLRHEQALQALGGLGLPIEFAGALASGNVNALAAPTLGGRIAQGAKAGAAGGGIAGFGYGEGLGSVGSAMGGAATGALFGAAIPPALEVVGNRVQGMRRLTGRDPELPRRMISEAITADANTPRAAGALMDDAATRGSPMMLADTGENSRALLSSVTRHPGPSRTIGKTATIERQNAQAERISAAVLRDLGPTANIRELGDALIEQARAASAPLYSKFEAASGASVVKLDDLATRPAFQRALKKAVDLSREESVDPTALGFRFNDAGEMVLDRDALSWKAMDYVKRALDDVIEASKDQRGKLTEAGRAALGTKKTLVARMDKVNPAYAEARKAYAGPAAMRDAVEKGNKALSKSPDDIMAELKALGDGEKEAYRLGVRKAIVDLVNSKRDGGDKVAHLLGTPKSRAVLSRIFGGKPEFDRFIATLRDEEAMGLTYKAVNTGSPTAERMAADATTNDAGLAETAMDAVVRGAQGGSMWSSLVAGLQHLRDVDRFGAGKAGEAAREGIAALLTETDPAVLKELVRAANRARAQQRVAQGRKTRNAARVGKVTGITSGAGYGSLTQEP